MAALDNVEVRRQCRTMQPSSTPTVSLRAVVGACMRGLRERHNLSQLEVAKLLDLSRHTICSRELGSPPAPTLDELVRLHAYKQPTPDAAEAVRAVCALIEAVIAKLRPLGITVELDGASKPERGVQQALTLAVTQARVELS